LPLPLASSALILHGMVRIHPRTHIFSRGQPARIVAWYLVLSYLWIISSDHLLAWAITDDKLRIVGQTVKGWVFVTAIGLLLWWHIHRALKHAQASASALDETQADYHRLIATFSDAVIIHQSGDTDVLRSVIEVNPACEHLTGWTRAELIGRPLEDLIFQPSVTLSRPGDGELRLRRKDGDSLPIDRSSHEHRGQDGQRLVTVIVRDLSERIAAQHRLLEAERLAAVGVITAGLAHEFNNLHAIINGQAEVLQQSCTESGQRARIEVITSTIKRAAGITHGLLALSRRGAQRRHVVPLDTIITDTVAILSGQLAADGVTLVVGSDSALPALVDHHQIGQVVMNLLINGWHAVAGLPRRQLTVTSGGNQNQVWLKVADTGHGMDPLAVASLFQPFFTTKRASKERPGITGTGLGLSLCQAIVESHSGTITVASAIGTGTTFTVTLPVAESDTPVLSQTPREGFRRIGGKVLVIDDEPLIRTMLRDYLSDAGFQVRVTDDGAEALRWLTTEPADVILLDHRMPKMSGPEFLRQLLARPQPAPKIIAISGWPEQEDAILIPAAVVPKPFSLEVMRAHIQDVIAN